MTPHSFVPLSRSNFTMAGLLTFPDLTSFPSRPVGAVDYELIKSKMGLQQRELFRIYTEFPINALQPYATQQP